MQKRSFFSKYQYSCSELTAAIAADDSEIDSRVYELYGLTTEEIVIVEQL